MTTDSSRVEGFEDSLALLRKWRADETRRADEVIELWTDFICPHFNKIGDEKWMLIEQVCIAALDLDRLDIVEACLDELRANFDDNSKRVRRITALTFEMVEDFSSALKIYDSIIDDDDSNSSARKRKIAILKAMGDVNGAVVELEKYLKEFMSDSEAWMELSELYISREQFSKAAFCWEEVIIHNPQNHAIFQRYGDIKYTQGGVENLEMARSYYLKSIALNPDNIRSYYGLIMANTQLMSHVKSSSQKKKDASKWLNFASQQLIIRYKESGAPNVRDVVTTLLQNDAVVV